MRHANNKKKIALIAMSLGVLSTACTNATTPEGYEGYVIHVPLLFGASHYVNSQAGPTSTGLVWRQFVSNVDMRPKNYTESFEILSRDNMNVGFEAHARVSLRAGKVREVVERYGTGAAKEGEPPEWFLRNVRQPYRSAVRDVVHSYAAYDIQTRTAEIGAEILRRLQKEYAKTPIQFETMSIGDLTYPAAINKEIEAKLAAEQDLERIARELQIAEQEAEIMVTNAKGRAAAQRIVNETLTPLYVQHEMLEGFRRLAKTDRVTIVSAPSGDGKSTPVILNANK